MAITGRAQAHDDRTAVANPIPYEPDANSDDHRAPEAVDQQQLLHGLQAIRVGDVSVRLPRDQVGLAG